VFATRGPRRRIPGPAGEDKAATVGGVIIAVLGRLRGPARADVEACTGGAPKRPHLQPR